MHFKIFISHCHSTQSNNVYNSYLNMLLNLIIAHKFILYLKLRIYMHLDEFLLLICYYRAHFSGEHSAS